MESGVGMEVGAVVEAGAAGVVVAAAVPSTGQRSGSLGADLNKLLPLLTR